MSEWWFNAPESFLLKSHLRLLSPTTGGEPSAGGGPYCGWWAILWVVSLLRVVGHTVGGEPSAGGGPYCGW